MVIYCRIDKRCMLANIQNPSFFYILKCESTARTFVKSSKSILAMNRLAITINQYMYKYDLQFVSIVSSICILSDDLSTLVP